MTIDDKYFNLLHTLIYDKRCRMCGILSSFEVTKYITGYGISFRAYMNTQNTNHCIFIEDFEKGNVVFLLPFGIKYKEDEVEEIAKHDLEKIKAFFGDKFRDDMIISISEDDRQNEIREWEKLTIGLENWASYFEHIKNEELKGG